MRFLTGLLLALLLAREKLRVALVRSPDDRRSEGSLVDIRSYALNAASRQLLADLKVWPDAAGAIRAMRVHEAGGAQLHFDAPLGESLGHIVDATSLDEELEQALDPAQPLAAVG